MTSGGDLDNSAHEERTVAQAFYNALVRDGLDILHEPERLRDALLAEAPDHPAMAVLRYNLDAELLAPYLEALGGNERPTEEELREAAGHAEVLLTEHRAIMQDAAHLATTQLSDGLATYLNVSATPAEENPAEQKAWYKKAQASTTSHCPFCPCAACRPPHGWNRLQRCTCDHTV